MNNRRREPVEAALAEVERRLRGGVLLAAERTGGDDVDQVQAHEQRELSGLERTRLAARARALRAALVRFDEGMYGLCVDCGDRIPVARLRLVPEAARCVRDQAAHERRGDDNETSQENY